MFNKIPKLYQNRGARVIKACLAAHESLPMNIATFLASDDPESVALNMPLDRFYDWFDPSLAVLTRKQINGWCQDMLTVDIPSDDQEDVVERRRKRDKLYRVNFVHRTVRDWMRETKMDDLDHRAGENFDPSRTLFAAYVSLIKKSFSLGPKARPQLVTGWSTFALLHASNTRPSQQARKLIQDLDVTMQAVFEQSLLRRNLHGKHWSNIATQPFDRSQQAIHSLSLTIPEKGHRDLLGHVIELGVFWYVDQEYRSNPSVFSQKTGQGRPYLDYALRHAANTRYRAFVVISNTFLPRVPFPDPRMVQFLLEAGCSVNERVWTQEGRTIWGLFLGWIHDEWMWANAIEPNALRRVTWLLIDHGAQNVTQVKVRDLRTNVTSKYGNDANLQKEMTMRQILTETFGEEESNKMCERVARNTKGWFSLWW